MHNRNRRIDNGKYCSTGHPQRQFLVYGKMCGSCGMSKCLTDGVQVNAEAVARPEVTEEC